jgi:hypothetical protein
MGYPRFTRELLSAGSEIDQAEVQEFLQEPFVPQTFNVRRLGGASPCRGSRI